MQDILRLLSLWFNYVPLASGSGGDKDDEQLYDTFEELLAETFSSNGAKRLSEIDQSNMRDDETYLGAWLSVIPQII